MPRLKSYLPFITILGLILKEKLKLIFDNIENVNVFDSKFGNNYYDIFDGHLNNEANDYHMKKLSEIIKKN